VALSRDGEQAFVQLVNPEAPGFSIWSYDIDGERMSRITFDPNSAVPVPSPDGEHIAISSNRSGDLEIYIQPLGRNDPKPLFAGGLASYGKGRPADAPEIVGAFPLDWSPGGSLLVYCTSFRGRGAGLWAVSLDGGGTPIPIQPSPFVEEDAAVSPDGGWIAYTSNASGRYEVYLARFPEGGRTWPVSSNGGIRPEWNPKGGELFFVSPDYTLMSVTAELDEERPVLGAARPLFSVEGRLHLFTEPGIYAVAPDGESFLVNRVVDTAEPTFLNLIVGWPEEISPR
jgi:hypothetical protein